MSEQTENAEALSADSPARPKEKWTSPERAYNVLLGLSVAQLILGLLLYMIVSINVVVYGAAGMMAISIALLAHFKGDSLAARVVARILLLIGMAGSILAGLGFLLYAYSTDAEWIQIYIILVVAFFALPLMLFLQPVFVISAEKRRRLDMVLLLIAAIFTFLLSLALCFYALAYSSGDDPYIVTSNSYSFTIFGQDINFTLGIDCLFSRLLFCACSGAVTVFSFLLRSDKSLNPVRNPDSKEKKSKKRS